MGSPCFSNRAMARPWSLTVSTHASSSSWCVTSSSISNRSSTRPVLGCQGQGSPEDQLKICSPRFPSCRQSLTSVTCSTQRTFSSRTCSSQGRG